MTDHSRTRTDLTVRCTVARSTTTIVVAGRADAHRCRTLRDALEMACLIRRHGPIVVDLTDAEHLTTAAVAILRRAADGAGRDRGALTVRKVQADAVTRSMPTHDACGVPAIDDGDVLRTVLRTDEALCAELPHGLDGYAGRRGRWRARSSTVPPCG